MGLQSESGLTRGCPLNSYHTFPHQYHRDARMQGSLLFLTLPNKYGTRLLFNNYSILEMLNWSIPSHWVPNKSQSLDNNDHQPTDNTLWKKIWDYKFSLRFETFCGEHSRILSQPSLTLGKERSWRMICAISVKRQPKMWFMHYGVWSYDSTWNYNATPHFASFRDLVKHIIDTSNDLNLFTTTVWAIWYCRNFMRTNEQPFPIQQIF